MKLILIKDIDDPDAANWYVDGLIEDQSYRFILDTGASLTSMGSDDYLSRFTTKETKSSAGAFAKANYDLITVPNLRISSLSKTDLTVARAANTGQDKRNVLGMNFFVDQALHFVFESSEVRVLDKSPVAGELLDLFLGERNHPYVNVSWEGGVHAQGVWDTGAGMSVFDLSFVKKHPQLFKPAGHSTGTDSTGAKSETPVYEMKGFTLAGKRFPTTRVVAVDLSVPNSTVKIPMDFILGYPVLRQANWFFDFPRRKWGISKML